MNGGAVILYYLPLLIKLFGFMSWSWKWRYNSIRGIKLYSIVLHWLITYTSQGVVICLNARKSICFSNRCMNGTYLIISLYWLLRRLIHSRNSLGMGLLSSLPLYYANISIVWWSLNLWSVHHRIAVRNLWLMNLICLGLLYLLLLLLLILLHLCLMILTTYCM